MMCIHIYIYNNNNALCRNNIHTPGRFSGRPAKRPFLRKNNVRARISSLHVSPLHTTKNEKEEKKEIRVHCKLYNVPCGCVNKLDE